MCPNMGACHPRDASMTERENLCPCDLGHYWGSDTSQAFHPSCQCPENIAKTRLPPRRLQLLKSLENALWLFYPRLKKAFPFTPSALHRWTPLCSTAHSGLPSRAIDSCLVAPLRLQERASQETLKRTPAWCLPARAKLISYASSKVC